MNSSDLSSLEALLRDSRRSGGKAFSYGEVATLARYYELVLKWNPRLHLTTVTDPREFFERHIVESALAEQLIHPSVDAIWDLGSGAGIPGLVNAILRSGLPVSLVEANRKKAIFLEEAVADLKLANVRVFGRRFETLEPAPEKSCVMTRAIEEMERLIPEILGFGRNAAQILVFGNKSLGNRLRQDIGDGWIFEELLIPGSKGRFLFNAIRST